MRATDFLSLGTVALLMLGGSVTPAHAADEAFTATDIFNLEYAADPRITPDGTAAVYVRRSVDIMSDRTRSNIWQVGLDGSGHRPLLSGKASYAMPRFSPDGTRMAYVSAVDGKTQIYVRWLDTGETARVTDLQQSPGALSWSPDSKSIAFTMLAPEDAKPLYSMPKKPEGATWAGDAKVIDRVIYRVDGQGYLPQGYSHVFVVPADGGTPRQLTSGKFDEAGPLAWTPDSRGIIFSANRSEDWMFNPRESDLHRVDVATGQVSRMTTRQGPDYGPQMSPDGTMVAYLGYDDRGMSHQNASLYVMNIDGSGSRSLTETIDRNIDDIQWAPDGKGLYYTYDNQGKRLVAYVNLTGSGRVITDAVGGTSLGRPYTSGDYRATGDGRVVFTRSQTDRPADLVAVDRIGRITQLTDLNSDVLGTKKMASVEEVSFASSVDGRQIQFWAMKPASFDPLRKYPLILEIHGGPHAAYGPHFSAEMQAYASAGYVVLYGNPRGSTSYGEEFANTIHHNYPSNDYDDLMDAVNQVIGQGYVDADRLYITGGSGGGVLTAWSVGKTNRFRAAVVAKPVINWTSFVLTSDFSPYFVKYWFDGKPWDNQAAYWAHSPLSLVGNVTTPTMVLTGEEDYRTPMSETEQYYKALKLQKVPSVMVRIPGAGHGIAARPSNLVQKIGNILAWFDRYKPE